MMWWRPTATALAARRLSLQAPAWRPLQLAVAASGSATPAFAPPLHASGSIFVRTLRGGRSQRRRAAQAAYEAELAAAFKREQKKAARAARPPPPPPAVPSYIRVRDLAKLLRKPVEDVLKKVATRRNRRLHVTVGSDRFEFKNIKEVILPFHVAEQVAAAFDMPIAFDDVEPTLLRWPQRTAASSHIVERTPVIAVMGHVDHGKTTLMDTLRGSSIAAREVHGITQKINICETQLTPSLRATFLDTPGHFHFFRMRNNAAQVADLVVLIVAADEGCLLQTEESIGAIEETGLPVIACVNKIDLASPEQIESVRAEIRSFVALQTCPIVEISGKTGQQLAVLKEEITQLLDTQRQQHKLEAYIGPDVPAQGLVLESLVLKGRGTVLRVLLKHGVLKKQDHFVAGMIHGVVRSVRNSDSGVEVPHALPGMVVDVAFANKSKNVDAPIEFGFFVLPEARARQVIETRQLASDFAESALPVDDNDQDPAVHQAELVERAPATHFSESDDETEVRAGGEIYTAEDSMRQAIVVKADSAGSLTSIQDTVDEMQGVNTVRIGIGHITASDIDVAINQHCPIFGFNVKLRNREQKLAIKRGVRIVIKSTIHGLIEEIERFSGDPQPK